MRGAMKPLNVIRCIAAIVAAAMGTAIASCREEGYPGQPPLPCTDYSPTFAVVVQVRDSATGRYIAAGTSYGADDGISRDTVIANPTAPDTGTVGLGMRPGTWSVRVWKPGYNPWRRDGIVVADSTLRCPTPRTVALTALLTPVR